MLEGKSEIDAASLSKRFTALENDIKETREETQKAREESQKALEEASKARVEARKEAQKAREEAQGELRAVEERFRLQFAVVEKKLLKLTAANRNFRILAERLDKSQHRERRPAKVAETSKIIGATLVKVSEITMPVCNEVSKYAREIHRSGLSVLEMCDLA